MLTQTRTMPGSAERNTTELENVIIANERNVNLLLIYLCMSSITIRIEEDFGISLSVSLFWCACIIESGHLDCSYDAADHTSKLLLESDEIYFHLTKQNMGEVYF